MRCRTSSTAFSAADLLLKRQLLWLFLLRTLFLTLLLGLTALILAKGHDLPQAQARYITTLTIGVYLFTLASAALMRIIRCYRQFAYLQVLVDILLTSLLVFYSGSSQSVFTALFFLPVIAGGLMLFRTGGLLMAAISTLAYGGLLAFEYAGHTRALLAAAKEPAANLDMLLHTFSINGLSFFLVSVLSATLAERLYKAEASLTQTASNYDRLALLYKQIFDDITTGVITVDGSNTITSFNRAAEKITGYKAGELLGRQIERFFPGLQPVKEKNRRPLADLARKDGEAIPVGYSWSRLHTPDGCENCRVFTMQDLSLIRKMESQVRQAEKMAAIGEMAAGIAHEFRNPLAAISGSAQLLGLQGDDHPRSQKLTQIIIRECDRLESVIDEFLLFSKPSQPEKEWCRINQLLEETAQVLQQTPHWSSGFTLAITADDSLECWADRNQLKQVFLNLFSNSCQAMQNGNGEIALTAGEERGENDDEQLRIVVRDNGPGIPARHLARIFEPYFTTRKNGTGLGLAIVHQIIDSHGGTIGVASQEGQGTAFTIILPLP